MCRLILIIFGAFILLNGSSVQAQQKRKHEAWADEIDSFREKDKQREIAKGEIVFVGDSDIVLCDLQKWFPDTRALNRGFGGADMDDVLFYLNDVLLKYEPAIVVLSCGGNDIAGKDTPENVHREFQSLAAQLFARLPNCQLLVTAQHTPPLFAETDQQIIRLNELMKRTAACDERITFLPITRIALHDEMDKPNVELFRQDRLHFNDKGYRKWTSAIAAKLETLE